ncbi:type IV toxin-antitoxin system AbiEi family antitoxin domain-containing protein [Candidatus Binatus sp.]|uniref:type IV toxin-antitoxin system AbiEi family antitoxin domain-containing protein n=2 Tax=Candidatus Binatus sp. TaxID=2811406 RepID=UPI003C57DF52
MAGQRAQHLNLLQKQLPEGLVVTSSWLIRHGYSRQLVSHYVRSGWLRQPTRGVYQRPRGSLTWRQIVISLQTILKEPLVVGGRTSLEVQGYAHYLRPTMKEVYLYGPEPPPNWLNRLPGKVRFIYRYSGRLFSAEADQRSFTNLIKGVKAQPSRGADAGFLVQPWGEWDLGLALSAPERAILELLDELPGRESFEHADKLMEGLSNMRPQQLQKLLARCQSIKVKRLFFFFADRHQHAWLKRIDRAAVDLGKGKRMLAKGGKLDLAYQITVPRNLDAVQ